MVDKALKTVVEKVFLRLALMQKLAGPKHQEKSISSLHDAKGNRVKIPELKIIW